MADATEMIRLMRHAADLLDTCKPMANAYEVDRLTASSDTRKDAYLRAAQQVAANGTASTVLRMVAAAMADEPERASVSSEAGTEGRSS